MTNRFNKLKNNKSDFPHIGNVDVFAFDNEFDYKRFDALQMRLQLCTVPWDVGEAHVGQRTISGIGNVVWFETKEKRDAYFDAIPDSKCYRFDTKYKELHRDQVIDVPVPYDVAAKFNYLVVDYSMFANDSSPVMYETEDGLRRWFWFVREVEFVSPNTTRLYLLDDAFQTWMYDVTVQGMILERGHAPMFATRTDDYLKNPIENNSNLLAEDVNADVSAETVRHTEGLVFNSSDMYACIASTAWPQGEWGSKGANDWKVPTLSNYGNNGVPSVYVFAVRPENLGLFLDNITRNVPQFKQTVQGVFFASGKLLNISDSFTFGGVTCYMLTSTNKTFEFMELNKDDFGYPNRYRDIAKLYTYPYSHIEVTDENGNVDVIKIEDSTGRIDVAASLSLAYPFINLEAHLLGTGGLGTQSVTFRNIDGRSMDIGGRWYDTLREWKIPTFAVILDPSVEYDYSTHFDRAQRVIDYTTAYDNASANASTTKTDADERADTSNGNTKLITAANKGNADNSADAIVTNTATSVGTNNLIQVSSNSYSYLDVTLQNQYSDWMAAFDNDYTAKNTNAEIDAQYKTAAVGAASSAVQGAASGFASGGPIGAAIGAGMGIVSSAAGIANSVIGANLQQTQAQNAITATNSRKEQTQSTNAARTSNQNNGNNANTELNNQSMTAISATNAATQKENATRSQTAENTSADNTQATEKGINTRDYNTAISNAGRNRSQAQNAIKNDVSQAALRAPFVMGAFADGNSAVTKPVALFANVVTQSKAAIEAAGDYFLRYGYAYGKQWDFKGNWNIGKHFTYWKLSDFWVQNLNVPDLYMDKLRFFLFGGVTVWRNPDDIGNISVYDNF